MLSVQIIEVSGCLMITMNVSLLTTSRSDHKNDIVRSRLQESHVRYIVLPRERIYVRVVEASMLWKRRVVVDTPVAILVPSGWERKARLQIDNGRFISFGANICRGSSSLEVEGRQVWRFRSCRIDLGESLC